MKKINLTLLRGVCQIPAYVAKTKGFFADENLDVIIKIQPSAWQVPLELHKGEAHFSVIPWTRIAATADTETPLVLLAGSGYEEARIVVRRGMSVSDVSSVVVPQRGGMKDLTAMGLLGTLGWENIKHLRQPSGDGAIISFFGNGADAASMIEPYATMLEEMGVGEVVRKTGDLWPGAPSCSLCTSRFVRDTDPDLVDSFVMAFVRGWNYVRTNGKEAAEIAHDYIGVHTDYIYKALLNNQPNVNCVRDDEPQKQILSLMIELGYIEDYPSEYRDLSFLDRALERLGT